MKQAPARPASATATSNSTTDLVLPIFDYDKALTHVLADHTDVHTAENAIQKARFNLRLAQVTPIPDVEVQVVVQKDNTGPPFDITPSLHVTVPVPVWDQNHGGIKQAQANLRRTVVAEESPEARLLPVPALGSDCLCPACLEKEIERLAGRRNGPEADRP